MDRGRPAPIRVVSKLLKQFFMTAISNALLATIQKVREYYKITDPTKSKAVAIPPEWVNSQSLILHLQDKSDWTEAEKLQNEFELSQFVNAIITNPFTWEGEGNQLWRIFRQVMDSGNSEITRDILLNWDQARFDLNATHVKTNLEGIDFGVCSMDENPKWQKISIFGDQFEKLFSSARADSSFANIYEILKGNSLESLVSIREINFEMASVSVNRPWLREDLLENKQWRLRNGATISGKSFLSSSLEENAFSGALPGYPVAFILVRNFEVTLEMSEVPGEEPHVEDVHADQVIGFGPLVMQGQLQSLLKGKVPFTQIGGIKGSVSAVNELKFNFQFNKLPLNSRQFIFRNNIPFGLFSQANSKNLKIQTGPVSGIGSMSGGPHLAGFQTASSPAPSKSEAARSFTFNIRDRNTGAPVPGAGISLREVGEGDDLASFYVSTDHSGNAVISLGQQRVFALTIAKEAYKTFQSTLTVNKETPVNLEFQIDFQGTIGNKEKVSAVQLLAVVYHKLGTVPDPVEGFVPLEDSIE